MISFLERIQRQGGLSRYDPKFGDPDDAELRCVMLHPMVRDELDLKKSRIDEPKLLGIHGQLTAFVRGDRLTVSTPSGSGLDGDMKGLKPETNVVWQMRFREPMAYRILGLVPERDVFLGLRLLPRENLHWTQAVGDVLRIWNSWSGLPEEQPQLVQTGAPENAFSRWRHA